MTAYRSQSVDPERYRSRRGATMADYANEQDTAAGGRDARLITRSDGTPAAASVALRCFPKTRRVYAYLRWAEAHGTREQYLGDVSDYPDREAALHAAWQRARAPQLETPINPTAQARRD